MTATLDTLIQKTNRKSPTSFAERLVHIKNDSGEPLRTITFWSHNVTTFKVDILQEALCSGLQIELYHPSTGLMKHIIVSYSLKCIPDREVQAIKFLRLATSPQLFFDKMLQSWAENFVNQQPALIDNEQVFCTELADHFQFLAAANGLELNPQLHFGKLTTANTLNQSEFKATLVNEKKMLSPMWFTSHSKTATPINHDTGVAITPVLPPAKSSREACLMLKTGFKQCEHILDMEVQLNYEPGFQPDPSILSILEGLARTEIIQYCRENVPVTKYLFQRESLSCDLHSLLLSKVGPHGLRIESILLKGPTLKINQDFHITLEHTRQLAVGGLRKHDLTIYTRTRLQLGDLGQLLQTEVFNLANFQATSFRDWAEVQLGEFLERYFTECSLARLDERLQGAQGLGKASMAQQIEDLFARVGFRSELLDFEYKLDFVALQRFHEVIKVEHRLMNIDEPIVIENHIMMNLVDRSAYIKAGSPAVKDWLQQALNCVVQEKLLGYDYSRIALEFSEQIKQEIKEEITTQAGHLGYSVDLLTHSPRITPMAWMQWQDCQDTLDLKTRDTGLTVKLSYHISFCIPELNTFQIRPLIRPDVNLQEVIRKSLRTELESYFHGMDPRRYYGGFDRGFDEIRDDGRIINSWNPVRDELRNLISDHLESQFSAQIRGITPKQELDDVIRALNGINNLSQPFRFDLEPTCTPDKLTIEGAIQVSKVAEDGWQTFLGRAKQPFNVMVKGLEKYLIAKMEGLQIETLLPKSPEEHNALQILVDNLIRTYSKEQLGLVLAIDYIRIKSTFKDLDRELEIKRNKVHHDRASFELEEVEQSLKTAAVISGAAREYAKTEIGYLSSQGKGLLVGGIGRVPDAQKRAKTIKEEINAEATTQLLNLEKKLIGPGPGTELREEENKNRIEKL